MAVSMDTYLGNSTERMACDRYQSQHESPLSTKFKPPTENFVRNIFCCSDFVFLSLSRVHIDQQSSIIDFLL